MATKGTLLLVLLVVLSACTQLDPLLKTIAAPTGVSLNIGNYNLVKNFSMNFVPSVTPKEAQNTKFSLSTSNPLAVGLSGNRATSLSAGTSLITATAVAGGLTATAQINAVNWTAINPSGSVSHFAGSNDSVGSVDGTTGSARFFNPSGIVFDGNNLYVADSQNDTIRQIDLATSTVTTLAGGVGIATEVNGTGTAARFAHPSGICSNGPVLFVSDQYGATIRQVTTGIGVVTTLAGGTEGSADGTGLSAHFSSPAGICTDGTNLYVADSGNSTIRKVVIATAVVTTLAGVAGAKGTTDGIGNSARFYSPNGIASDGTNLYVTDQGNGTIRKIVISTGAVSTIVGSPDLPQNGDGIGTTVGLANPQGLYCDGTSLYFTDQYGVLIRQVSLATNAVKTIAGGFPNGFADGAGSAGRFAIASAITSDGTNWYITDSGNNSVRRLSQSWFVSTLAGKASAGFVDATGTSAQFSDPQGICSDETSFFVVDEHNSVIRRIDPTTASVTTFVGNPGVPGRTDGSGSQAQFGGSLAICTDGVSLFLIDQYGSEIRRVIISTGAVSTIAQTASAVGICTDGNYLYFSVTTGNGSAIQKMSIESGALSILASGLNDVRQLCTDGLNLYAAEGSQSQILKVDPSSGAVSVFAGSTTGGELDGIGSVARFSYPQGICTDGTSLYVSDTYGATVRKIALSNASVTTLAGANQPGNSDGLGVAATFQSPSALCTFGNSLFVVDEGNNAIRQIQ